MLQKPALQCGGYTGDALENLRRGQQSFNQGWILKPSESLTDQENKAYLALKRRYFSVGADGDLIQHPMPDSDKKALEYYRKKAGF